MLKNAAFVFFIIVVAFVFSYNTSFAFGHTTVTTTVSLAICGDGIVYPGQLCDDGEFNGTYSSTIEDRHCNTTCDGWAPHCGDNILQTQFTEECDEGVNEDTQTCSAQCEALDPPPPPPPPPPAGGSGPIVGGVDNEPRPTEVVIEGKAYPNTDVNVLKDGETLGVVRADGAANFRFSTTDVTPGTATFGFWAEDQVGLRSISLTVTTDITSNNLTTISGIFLPPTLDLSSRSVQAGEPLSVSGTSVPESSITVEINSPETIVDAAGAEEDGLWQYDVDTSELEEDELHSIKSLSEVETDGEVIRSGFSQTLSFFVGEGEAEFLVSDLNGDTQVNLVDFSILLFHWGTDNPAGDINEDGNVNLADFSILLFHWTG